MLLKKAQLGVQDEEIRSLKSSLDEEQRRNADLQQDMRIQTDRLHAHVQQLLQRQQEEQRENQRLQVQVLTCFCRLSTNQLFTNTRTVYFQGELQDSQSRLRNLEAELQGASNKAYNAEHQLTQLSLKVRWPSMCMCLSLTAHVLLVCLQLCSSEQLQQQIFLLNQQLLLLRETNRALSEQLEDRAAHNWTVRIQPEPGPSGLPEHTITCLCAAQEVSMLQCSVGKEFQRLKDSDVQQRQKLEAANHRIAELENQLSKKEQLILDQKKLMEDTKNQSRSVPVMISMLS